MAASRRSAVSAAQNACSAASTDGTVCAVTVKADAATRIDTEIRRIRAYLMTMWFASWRPEWRPAWFAAIAGLIAIVSIVATGQTIAPLQPDGGTGRVTYFIGPGEPKSEFRPSDTELATWALRAWERALDGALRFQPSPEDEALVRVHWVGPAGGQYGEMRPLLVR